MGKRVRHRKNPYPQDEIKTSLKKKNKREELKINSPPPTLMKSEGHRGAPEYSLMGCCENVSFRVNSERLEKCWLPVNSSIHQDKRKISLNYLPLS